MATIGLSSISFRSRNPRNHLTSKHLFLTEYPKCTLRASADSTNPKAKFIARRRESVSVRQLRRPLSNWSI
uniref:Uncharacterized protein n=1 Tax=Salix viminalis TaxID=40686 RepID=A0A6N2M0J1_SALVM